MKLNVAETYFGEELNKLESPKLRKIVCAFFDEKVPDYFWIVPASSSGKYHPSFDQGEMGLVRHTRMVCKVAEELLALNKFSECDKDMVIAACLLHDTFKNGYTDCEHTVSTHDVIAAEEWNRFTLSKYNIRYDEVYVGIRFHMGQWGSAEYNEIPLRPNSNRDKYKEIVHLADYIASRKFFDDLPKC